MAKHNSEDLATRPTLQSLGGDAGVSEVFKLALRDAEKSHTGMLYGDEKRAGASDYTRGFGDCLNAIKNAVHGSSVVDGWRWVPPVPTETMVRAAAGAPESSDAKQDIENMWRAMLVAAPSAAMVARDFTNELGNTIRITIEGPTSTSENILTPMEVANLRSALDEHAVLAAPAGAQQAVAGWLFDRIGSELNPHFIQSGDEADRLRTGDFMHLPCSNHTNWRPLYAAPVAALAAPAAAEKSVISVEDSLRTRLRWSQEKVEQLEHENRELRGRIPGASFDDLMGSVRASKEKAATPAPEAAPIAWVHKDDPHRAISASQKAQALRDGGASASSVAAYSIAAYASTGTPGAAPSAKEGEAPGLVGWLLAEATRHEQSPWGNDPAVRAHIDTLRGWVSDLKGLLPLSPVPPRSNHDQRY